MKSLKILFVLLLLAPLGVTSVPPVSACVGKTLLVGALDTPQQQVLANMLAILIG